MSYSEAYTPLNWHNLPSQDTALEADNLNHIEQGIKTNDTRITTIGNDAMYAADVANCLSGQPTIDQATGILTFPKKGGGSYTLDTLLEKVVTNFDYDADTGELVLYFPDGTQKRVSLSAFITENEFVDSSTIDFTVTGHNVTAVVKNNSIGDDQMVTSYLTDCQSAKSDAEAAATASETDALKSEGHAVGEQNGVPVDSSSPYYHNNSKYYAEQAEAIAGQTLAGLTDTDIISPQDGDVLTYDASSQMWFAGIPIMDSLGTFISPLATESDIILCTEDMKVIVGELKIA